MRSHRQEGLQSFFLRTIATQSGLDYLDSANDDTPEDLSWGNSFMDIYDDLIGSRWSGPIRNLEWSSESSNPIEDIKAIANYLSKSYGNAIGAMKSFDPPHQDGIHLHLHMKSHRPTMDSSLPKSFKKRFSKRHQEHRAIIDEILGRNEAPIAGPDIKPINKRKRKK